jgi:hypothetical protein
MQRILLFALITLMAPSVFARFGVMPLDMVVSRSSGRAEGRWRD